MTGTEIEMPASLKRGEVAAFKPKEAKKQDAKADAAIQYAKDVHDWETLEIAVDQKLKDQTKFVVWWKKAVTPNQGGDRKSDNQQRRTTLLMLEAETLTKIKQQQVSKWKRRLEVPAVYRDMLYGAAYRKAMGEIDLRGASG